MTFCDVRDAFPDLAQVAPHFCLVVLSLESCSQKLEDFLQIVKSLGIPTFIALTYDDETQDFKSSMRKLQQHFRRSKRVVSLVRLVKITDQFFPKINSVHIPYIPVCPRTGAGIDSLRNFMNNLFDGQTVEPGSEVHFTCTNLYQKRARSVVVAGFSRSGDIRTGDSFMLGPDNDDEFIRVKVLNIR